MMKTYKVLSAVLEYPSEELIEALPELEAALEEEHLVRGENLERLRSLLAALAAEDLMTLQERYVDLFDRVRSVSLHLFEHVHGESRDRGQAMIDLRQQYERHGYTATSCELPDYLPAFLEFLSRLGDDAARELLSETTHVLESIGARLARRGSLYAAAFEALLAITGGAIPADLVRDEDIRKEDDPATLDAQWQAEPAFGPTPSCGGARAPAVSVVKFHKGVAA
ncbi:MAG TPA: nitrate reductase molybdenum cofactor assembly chaperone [Burkholderiales bacterium]|nr:nitrate reductase molybdenum cofactor assembly chaperone [Burkholderiales bacterium]